MAFALDTVSGADHSHLPALEVEDGIKVAQVDSPVHMVALVPLEFLAGNKVSAAGSKVAADLVR